MAGMVLAAAATAFSLVCTGQSDFEGRFRNNGQWRAYESRTTPDQRKYFVDTELDVWCSGTTPCEGAAASKIVATGEGGDFDGYDILLNQTGANGNRWIIGIRPDGSRYREYVYQRENRGGEPSEWQTIAAGACRRTDIDLQKIRGMKEYSGTRWGRYGDCGGMAIALNPDGTVNRSKGPPGTWRPSGGRVVVDYPDEEGPLLERTGKDELTERGASSARWQRCDPNPVLTAAWLTSRKWGGCTDPILFMPGGEVRFSNGSSARWTLTGTELSIEQDGKQMRFTRYGDALRDSASGGTLASCKG
jgi:hypothetical protein